MRRGIKLLAAPSGSWQAIDYLYKEYALSFSCGRITMRINNLQLMLLLLHLLLFTSLQNAVTNVSACGGSINSAGTTYTLNQSINNTGATCISIGASNIIFDCQGFSISGNNSSNTYGIYSSQLNTTIRNCNISNFEAGIYYNGSTNGTIQNVNSSTTTNNVASPTYSSAIVLGNTAKFNTVANVNATSAYGHGIAVVSSSGNTITNSTATTGTGYAIYLFSTGSNNTISNSNGTGTGAGSYGIYINDNGNTELNDTINNSYGYGISRGGGHRWKE
jgi:parallel beta-helix repeat protein